jgi:hypothetical protein
MATLVVPRDEPGEEWPTLGPQIWAFLLERAVHGPGDLKGQPFTGDDEKRALVYRMYEVYPPGHRMAGRRRFKQVGISVRKGTAKTELGGLVAFVELHPEAPARCDGFDAYGDPVGRPVVDPYIPMLATTQEQVAELAYGALFVACTDGPDADLFDAGLDRIVRLDGRGRADGKAVPLATAPDSRDGARTTFQDFDETHRLTLPRQVKAWETMLQNVPKRVRADAWSLSHTTTYTPGEGSVAQLDHERAESIAKGEVEDPTVMFFHREAGPEHKIGTPDGLRAAIREASGPAIAAWDGFEAQVEGIASLYHQALARGNGAYFERVWLNRRRAGDRTAFDLLKWRSLGGHQPPKRGTRVTAGFDGSRWRDGTGIVLTDLERMVQWKYALWTVDPEHPEIDADLVDAAVDEVFERFNVVRWYLDPAQGWDKRAKVWADRHGPKRVVEFYTDSRGTLAIGRACRSYSEAIAAGELGLVDDPEFSEHIGHASKRDLKVLDEDGQPLWTIEKETRDSPYLMDLAMCGVLSWRAALDAIKAGEHHDTDSYAYVF